MDTTKLTVKKAHQALVNKEISSIELTKSYLNKIKTYNEKYNVYLTITADNALEQATKTDNERALGKNLPALSGIPAAIKDVIVTKDVRTTASSKMLDNFIPPYQSTTIERLNDNGMVMLGKVNCDAFAFGGSTENSGYGPTKNPWDVSKVPGGSSGGSAAAVSADLSIYAIGTDTGGSIRQPASLCGVTGLKLTYGRASRFGLMAMASSFDTPGPIAKTVEDCAIIAEAISGYDQKDGTTTELPVPKFSQNISQNIKGMKIGVLSESYGKGVEDGVKKGFDASLKTFRELGAELIDISLPKLAYGIAAYYILVPSEISSNLARYDGVRFGHRSQQAGSLLDMQMRSREESLEDEVKRRIMLGNYTLSSGYYDAYYLKAAKVRTLIKHEFFHAFEKLDAIICPTSPTVAFDIGSKSEDPLAMYLADIFTVSVNLAGIPALSVPCGFSNGLPVGLQIIGKAYDEETILRVGHNFEQATEWHTKFPEVSV
ncbi:MAG: Asp-tRNA(Asn)/Glu-tRNA(Gln) amidotransferase subunit GatA [bacterium]|nr:Asp-tRNA(Asn)/Glu-tRNA(Gln) amidotransferase subunit GatA [bacterium]